MAHPPSILQAIDTIWIDPEVQAHPLARRIRDSLPNVRTRTGVPEPRPTTHPASIDRIKKSLFVTKSRGHLVKPCPGSRGRICCGYWVINAMMHCPMDCHYCVLQTYLSVPAMTIFVDEGSIHEEILARLRDRENHFFRFGTGELGDSLIHDTLTGFSRRFISFFAETQNGILELKSKTAAIAHLMECDPKGHTVISWSVNPPEVIRQVEPKTASLEKRIQAARQCQDMGYWIGLHFDPIIAFEGWEEAYRGVIERLARALDPSRIIWISVAGLRYTRQQKESIRLRFPETPLFSGEFFRDEDGKYRYLQKTRIMLYQKIISWLRQWDPNLFIYYCMENQRVWEKTFPHPPRNTRELDEKFDQRIRRLLKNG